jgi:hypothetical protein
MTAVSSKPATSRPRLRSEGMAPDGAALETSARHSPGVSSQVDTQPSPTRALFAFTHVDGTGRSGPAAASPMGRPIVSAGDEVSASLLSGFATANDIGLYRRTGCPPGYGGSRLRAWHTGRDIDNFLSIGISQAPKGVRVMRRRIASALSVVALVALPLGLTATPALADAAQTATFPCSDIFGQSATGTATIKQNGDKTTVSLHCNTDAPGPDHAVLFKCNIFGPDVKGQVVVTPSGNFEGHCSFPP